MHHRIAEFLLIRLPAPTVISLITPDFHFIEGIPISGEFYMSTQLGHVGKDLRFIADILFLGRRLNWINYE